MRHILAIAALAAPLILAAAAPAHANKALVHGDDLATTQPRDTNGTTTERLAFDVDLGANHAHRVVTTG
jgi:ABC-type amino acid transport substrate-binding protein